MEKKKMKNLFLKAQRQQQLTFKQFVEQLYINTKKEQKKYTQEELSYIITLFVKTLKMLLAQEYTVQIRELGVFFPKQHKKDLTPAQQKIWKPKSNSKKISPRKLFGFKRYSHISLEGSIPEEKQEEQKIHEILSGEYK